MFPWIKDKIMDMNKAFYARKEDAKPRWIVLDAKGRILGRFATQIAEILRGKGKPTYTPHSDAGDCVVIINAQDVVLSGNKLKTKIYDRYTGWMGGYKTMTAEELMDKDPARVIELAVKRMLPKNKLSDAMIKKLRIYQGKEHPHKAQTAA